MGSNFTGTDRPVLLPLLPPRFIQADLHTVCESSPPLGRNPSTFPGTSSRRRIPETVSTESEGAGGRGAHPSPQEAEATSGLVAEKNPAELPPELESVPAPHSLKCLSCLAFWMTAFYLLGLCLHICFLYLVTESPDTSFHHPLQTHTSGFPLSRTPKVVIFLTLSHSFPVPRLQPPTPSLLFLCTVSPTSSKCTPKQGP